MSVAAHKVVALGTMGTSRIGTGLHCRAPPDSRGSRPLVDRSSSLLLQKQTCCSGSWPGTSEQGWLLPRCARPTGTASRGARFFLAPVSREAQDLRQSPPPLSLA